VVQLDVAVPVPGDVGHSAATAVCPSVKLHETNSTFDEPSRGDALFGDKVGFALTDAVSFVRLFRFARHVHCFRSGGLHAISEFKRFQPRGQVRFMRPQLLMLCVHCSQHVELCTLLFVVHRVEASEV
jgi:hypothetical protein